MCTVIDVARRTYYEAFDKTKSAREQENEELKASIKRIYKEKIKVYMVFLKFIIYSV